MPTQNSWNNQVTAAGVTFTGGQIDIGTDAAAYNVNVGTGAAAKTVTVGNTTGASVLALKYGTGDYTLASASGTVMSALDSGEITSPLQPSFHAYLSSSTGAVTGDGTVYTVICGTEDFDKGSDYNNGTGIFTAPVDGTYAFEFDVLTVYVSGHNEFAQIITTSDATFGANYCSPDLIDTGDVYGDHMSIITHMDAADTAYFSVRLSGGAKNVTVSNPVGGIRLTYVSGSLLN